MLDPRQLLTLIAGSTQEECREMGKLFLSMADRPRDVHWRADFAEKLATMPVPPEDTISGLIFARRCHVAAEQDALRETGWHPDQMRRELEARGYTGIEEAAEPVS